MKLRKKIRLINQILNIVKLIKNLKRLNQKNSLILKVNLKLMIKSLINKTHTIRIQIQNKKNMSLKFLKMRIKTRINKRKKVMNKLLKKK
jgi:hypothetical protein